MKGGGDIKSLASEHFEKLYNREIFFLKLREAQMMAFDAIATKLIAEYGYEPDSCGSDDEAIEKPVHHW